MSVKTIRTDGSKVAICYYRSPSALMGEEAINRQREEARDWAKAEGYEIVKEYEDCSRHDTPADRSGLRQMLSDVSTLRPSVLIVFRIEHLGRKQSDVLRVRKTLSDAGCLIHSIYEDAQHEYCSEADLLAGTWGYGDSLLKRDHA